MLILILINVLLQVLYYILGIIILGKYDVTEVDFILFHAGHRFRDSLRSAYANLPENVGYGVEHLNPTLYKEKRLVLLRTVRVNHLSAWKMSFPPNCIKPQAKC